MGHFNPHAQKQEGIISFQIKTLLNVSLCNNDDAESILHIQINFARFSNFDQLV